MILYGHRGARGEAPENTVAGFLYARRLYLDGVTIDVRRSSDDVVVATHDETVDRTTGARQGIEFAGVAAGVARRPG
jgi:glycerophosphoryl diester phosphodiesterase